MIRLKAVSCSTGPARVSAVWENFRQEQIFRSPQERAERLAEWGAVWVEDKETWSRYLEFESEADATVFILRWS